MCIYKYAVRLIMYIFLHGRLSYTLSGDVHVAPEGLIQFEDTF